MILEQGEYRGYKYVVTNGTGVGFRTAYVQIPEGHPWYKKDYDSCRTSNADYVDVHGGLTYSDDKCPHVDSSGWWVGFDAAHLADWVDPQIITDDGLLRDPEHMKDWVKNWNRTGKGTTKTTDYMANECKKIIDQAIEVATPKALNP